MMTKDEAKYALETELRSRKLVKPMTLNNERLLWGDVQTAGIQIPQGAAHGHSEMGQGVAV